MLLCAIYIFINVLYFGFIAPAAAAIDELAYSF